MCRCVAHNSTLLEWIMSCVIVSSEFQYWFLGQSGIRLQQSLPQRSVCASVCVCVCYTKLWVLTDSCHSCSVAVGIPYLTQDEESQLREQYEERRGQINGNGPITYTPNSSLSVSHVPEDQRAFIKTVEWVTHTYFCHCTETVMMHYLHWCVCVCVCAQRQSWRSSEELWEICGPGALHRVSVCVCYQTCVQYW